MGKGKAKLKERPIYIASITPSDFGYDDGGDNMVGAHNLDF
jgi:hypothetical protein